MAGIVEQLREIAPHLKQQAPVQYGEVAANAMRVAAAEIERLRALNAEMREVLKKARGTIYDGLETDGPVEPEWSQQDKETIQQIDAIIAKAEGDN